MKKNNYFFALLFVFLFFASCKSEVKIECSHSDGFIESGKIVESATLTIDKDGYPLLIIDNVNENYKCKTCEKEFPKTKLLFTTDNNKTTIGIAKKGSWDIWEDIILVPEKIDYYNSLLDDYVEGRMNIISYFYYRMLYRNPDELCGCKKYSDFSTCYNFDIDLACGNKYWLCDCNVSDGSIDENCKSVVLLGDVSLIIFGGECIVVNTLDLPKHYCEYDTIIQNPTAENNWEIKRSCGICSKVVTEKCYEIPEGFSYIPFSKEPVYMSKTETTYKKWYEVYQWAISHNYTFESENIGSPDFYGIKEGIDGEPFAIPTESNKPVSITQFIDCLLWCNAASEMEGLEPVYYLNDEVLRNYRTYSQLNKDTLFHDTPQEAWIKINQTANGYYIPQNKESFVFAAGDINYLTENDVNEIGWFSSNSEGSVHDVGLKKPNKFGLFDIYGNLGEIYFSEFESYFYNSAESVIDYKETLNVESIKEDLEKFNKAISEKKFSNYSSGVNKDFGRRGFRIQRRVINYGK